MEHQTLTIHGVREIEVGPISKIEATGSYACTIRIYSGREKAENEFNITLFGPSKDSLAIQEEIKK